MARQSLFAAVAATTVALVGAVDTTTTVSLLAQLGKSEHGKLAGSVVGVGGDKTTYALGCEAGTPEDECPVGRASVTVVQGPSTFLQSIHATMSDWEELMDGKAASGMEELVHQTATVSHELSCELSPEENQAECDAKFALAVGSKAFSMQANKVIPSYKELMTAVVVTAGADKLSPAPGATQTGNVPATTGGAESAAGASRTTGAAVTSLATRSGPKAPASAASASTTSATTNAAGALTPRNLGLAGVAAVVGGGLLLL